MKQSCKYRLVRIGKSRMIYWCEMKINEESAKMDANRSVTGLKSRFGCESAKTEQKQTVCCSLWVVSDCFGCQFLHLLHFLSEIKPFICIFHHRSMRFKLILWLKLETLASEVGWFDISRSWMIWHLLHGFLIACHFHVLFCLWW